MMKYKLFVFDVDGIFTDGRIHLGENGEVQQSYHVHDGLALKKAFGKFIIRLYYKW